MRCNSPMESCTFPFDKSIESIELLCWSLVIRPMVYLWLCKPTREYLHLLITRGFIHSLKLLKLVIKPDFLLLEVRGSQTSSQGHIHISALPLFLELSLLELDPVGICDVNTKSKEMIKTFKFSISMCF